MTTWPLNRFSPEAPGVYQRRRKAKSRGLAFWRNRINAFSDQIRNEH
jgi:hypothetical protein